MKIYVSSALKKDDIVNLLTSYNENGVSFRFIKRTGLKMEFEAAGVEGAAASDLVKKLIRGTDYGPALYFSVSEF